jgi:small subunit ribosomal protein S20
LVQEKPKEAKVLVKQNTLYGVTKRQKNNRNVKTGLKTRVGKAVKLIADKDAGAKDAVKVAVQALDKAVGKGVLHRNSAARRKSRLVKRLNKSTKA